MSDGDAAVAVDVQVVGLGKLENGASQPKTTRRRMTAAIRRSVVRQSAESAEGPGDPTTTSRDSVSTGTVSLCDSLMSGTGSGQDVRAILLSIPQANDDPRRKRAALPAGQRRPDRSCRAACVSCPPRPSAAALAARRVDWSVDTLQVGVQSYALDHGGAYPTTLGIATQSVTQRDKMLRCDPCRAAPRGRPRGPG